MFMFREASVVVSIYSLKSFYGLIPFSFSDQAYMVDFHGRTTAGESRLKKSEVKSAAR